MKPLTYLTRPATLLLIFPLTVEIWLRVYSVNVLERLAVNGRPSGISLKIGSESFNRKRFEQLNDQRPAVRVRFPSKGWADPKFIKSFNRFAQNADILSNEMS